MIALTRRYRFSAAHVLARADWSDERNDQVYGKCANPAGHGHDYGLEVTVGGEVDPASGNLVILDWSPDQVIIIDPDDGTVVDSFALSFEVNFGDIAIHPTTGNLWIASSQVSSIAEVLLADGSSVSTVDLTSQSIANELSGLAFDSSNNLLASSLRGVVYQLDLPVVTP